MNRMRVFWRATWLALLSTLFLQATAGAASYRFHVRSMQLDAYITEDASVWLEYRIDFANQSGAHVIDIVDVGLPHSGYQTSSMEASVDGKPVRRIRPSEYVNVGVECHLGVGAIRGGQTGMFEFACRMPDMVYSDTTDAQYASFQIRPTWFDPELQFGTTQLKVAVHLPPDVKPEEVRFQQEKQRYAGLAEWGEGAEKHTVAYWESPQMTLSKHNPKFSLSFPRRVMKHVIEKSKTELLLEWFDDNQQLKVISAVALFGLLGFFFYRFSRGTGCVLFLISAGMLLVAIISGPAMHLLCWPGLIGLVALNELYLRNRKPPSYLPAMATVEGGGIKRGLTAPQAAILLEEPLGKILTMVVFGLLKKRVVQLTSEDPASVTVESDYVCPRKQRRQRAAKNGIVLHDYEHPFIDRLQTHQGAIEKCDLNEALGNLIKSTVKRMQGFDLRRTRDYYQRIVKRAWKDASSIGQIEQRDVVVDRNFEWMMMEDDWADLFDVWRRGGYIYYPRWTRPGWPTGSGSRPSGGGATATGGATTTGGRGAAPSGGSSPSFGEVAGSFIGWTENTAGRMARAIEPSSLGIDLPSGASIDLSGIDTATGNFFEALAEASANSGGGGGGGGGCACACAGCACACACAGGGR
jgi:hypothetical protein